MRKILGVFILGVMLAASSVAYAGVRFITDVPRNSFSGKAQPNSSASISSRCAAAGYTKTAKSCGKGKIATNPCPYGGGYYKSCCDEEYQYTKEYCIRRGLKPSANSCEGKHACY